jgi:hypothetical protein
MPAGLLRDFEVLDAVQCLQHISKSRVLLHPCHRSLPSTVKLPIHTPVVDPSKRRREHHAALETTRDDQGGAVYLFHDTQ